MKTEQAISAEELYQNLEHMPAIERQKFFNILSTNAFHARDLSHEQLFGHLADDRFTARQAAEYLEVSMSTLRRHITNGKLNPSATVGRNQLFAVSDLKQLKKAFILAKGSAPRGPICPLA